MRKILSFLCALFVMQIMAQEDVKVLPTEIKVIPSSSSRFDVSQLQLMWNGVGMSENGFVWDSETSSFKGNVSYSSYQSFISLGMPDGSISYEGPVFVSPEADKVEVTADFSPYHFVNVVSASPSEYTVELKYMYNADNDDEVSESPGVRTNTMPDGMYKRNGSYRYDLNIVTSDGIPVVLSNDPIEVKDKDLLVEVGEKLDNMTLVTFQVEDADGNPAVDSDVNIYPADAETTVLVGADGKAKVYVRPGDYFFYISRENYMDMIDKTNYMFTASGKAVTVPYSYKDAGWKKIVFTAPDFDQYSSSSLFIFPVGTEYTEFDAESDEAYFEIYMPEGEYHYSFRTNSGEQSNSIKGLFNTAETQLININSEDVYGVKWDLVNVPEDQVGFELYVYRDGEIINNTFFSSESNPNVRGALDCQMNLTPGEYTYVVKNYGDIYSNATIWAAAQIQVNGNMTETIDLSKINLVEVNNGIKNRPSILDGATLYCSIETNDGAELIENYFYSSEFKTVAIAEGEYNVRWKYNMYDGAAVMNCVDKVKLTGSRSDLIMDFNQMGMAHIKSVVPERMSLDYLVVMQGDKQMLGGEVDVDDECYFIGYPGEYSIRGFATDYNEMNAHVSADQTVNLQSGKVVDVDLNIDQKHEGTMLSLEIENVKGGVLAGAVVTINGKVYKADDRGELIVFELPGNEYNLKIEAAGYKTYEKTLSISGIMQYVGGTYVTVVLEEDNGGSDISAVNTGDLRILNKIVDGSLEMDNNTDTDWNVRLVAIDGTNVANYRIGKGAATISVDGLSKGIYILVMDNGSVQKSVKIIKK